MPPTKAISENLTRNQYHAVAPLEDGLEKNKNKEIKTENEKKTKQRQKRKQAKKKKWTILKLIVFTFVYFGYALIGSYFFAFIESPKQEEFRLNVNRWKNDTSILLATDLRKIVPYEADWAKTVYRHLDIFEKDILKACLQGYRSELNSEWSFVNSFRFSLSVMTTTDYEDITIRSAWGKLLLLFYLSVGLPLTVIWLFFIGFYLTEIWIWLLSGNCFFKRKRKIHPITNIMGKQYIIERPITRPSSSAILTSPKDIEKHFDLKNIKPQKTKYFKFENLTPPLFLAILFFFFYYIFGSIAIYLNSQWSLVDCLLFNFLTLFGIRTRNIEKANFSYLLYILGGYWLLSMLLHLTYRKLKQMSVKNVKKKQWK